MSTHKRAVGGLYGSGAGGDPHEVWLCRLVGSGFPKAVESGSRTLCIIVELFIFNKYYCWTRQVAYLSLGPKSVSFPKVKLTFVNVTVKNVIPAMVKLYALKAGLLLLWVSLTRRALFLSKFSSNMTIFHQML